MFHRSNAARCPAVLEAIVPASLATECRIGVAIDAEFIKRDGRFATRMVAFVPFILRKPNRRMKLKKPPTTQTADAAKQGQKGAELGVRVPLFTTSLSLDVETVMGTADVLPCGHALKPIASEINQILQGSGAGRADVPSSSSSIATTRPQRLVRHQHAYAIPNFTRLGDPMRALCSKESSGLRRDAALSVLDFKVKPFTKFGRRRRGSWALAAHLRDTWLLPEPLGEPAWDSMEDAWQRACVASRDEQLRVAAECRTDSVLLPRGLFSDFALQGRESGESEVAQAAGKGGCVRVPNRFVQVATEAEMGQHLASLLAAYGNLNRRLVAPLNKGLPGAADGSLFVSYGSEDRKAMRETLKKRGDGDRESEGAANALQLVDVTASTAFRSGGFAPGGQTVGLETAVELLSTSRDPRSAAAREFLRQPKQPHNPLWDAAALGAVAVGLV